MEEIKLPPGFRFRPTDEELINGYLVPKNLGQPLPCNTIQEKPLYSGDPWRVLDIHDPHNRWEETKADHMSIYVFTKLTKVKQEQEQLVAGMHAGGKKRVEDDGGDAGGKEQFVRSTGNGTWNAQTGPKKIKEKGKVIGFKRNLVFKTKETLKHNTNPSTSTTSSSGDCKPAGYHYIMHEYTLPGDNWEYVLCKITLKLKKRKTSDLDENILDDDEQTRVPKRSYSSSVFDHQFGSTSNSSGGDVVQVSSVHAATGDQLAMGDQLDGCQPAAIKYDNDVMMITEKLGGNKIDLLNCTSQTSSSVEGGFNVDNGYTPVDWNHTEAVAPIGQDDQTAATEDDDELMMMIEELKGNQTLQTLGDFSDM